MNKIDSRGVIEDMLSGTGRGNDVERESFSQSAGR